MTLVKAINTKDNLQAKITTSSHQILADEPIAVGGKNEGPTPDDLLASALAACTAITLRMYINHKKIAINDIHVEINLEYNKEDQTTTFDRKITIEGEYDEAILKRLTSVANACPIHKMLSATVLIKTELVPSI
ncbi:MAG TPA: OsmC family protein [Chitinophagales bacterium]|nr:OsmC family protein [Chitinophagales bacterium]